MLKQRILAALVMIPIVVAALFMLPIEVFAFIVLVICALGCWEWAQFVGWKQGKPRYIFTATCSLLLAIMYYNYYCHHGFEAVSLLESPFVVMTLWLSLGWWLMATLLVLSYPASARYWQNSTLFKSLFGIFTILPFFWGIVVLRQYLYLDNPHLEAWWLLYVMVLVWGADSGAYTFGRLFGKNKLAPKVSPNKTIEGLIGGVLTAGVIACLFNLLTPLSMPITTLLFCSVVAVFASVLGDLVESMFKREAGIKDSGNLIPGHGGILDRIDSLTAAVPVFACLVLLAFKL